MLTRRSVIIASVLGASPMLATRAEAVDFPGFPFLLELDGRVLAGFEKFSFEETSPGFVPRSGTGSSAVRPPPGMARSSPITLTHGVTRTLELAQWCQGIGGHKNGSIISRDGSGAEKARWLFRNGIGGKYQGTSAISAGELAIEFLIILSEHLEKVG